MKSEMQILRFYLVEQTWYFCRVVEVQSSLLYTQLFELLVSYLYVTGQPEDLSETYVSQLFIFQICFKLKAQQNIYVIILCSNLYLYVYTNDIFCYLMMATKGDIHGIPQCIKFH